ncbi:MAG: hypothetical protein Q7J04_01580 [Microcella sp.]|nr:hypothetical protein [Microcella sp.]
MADDLSTADTAQLEAWAFGRRGADADPQRPDAALVELARRAEAARVEAAASPVAPNSAADGCVAPADKPAPPPPSPEELRHRRRMLATGRAGVAAAAIAALVGIPLLMQPNPNPLAVFDRPPTALDVTWQQQLDAFGMSPSMVLGPRAVDVGDDRVAIVYRFAARADGVSTAWDPYCLMVPQGEPGGDSLSWTGACVLPEEFERDGLVAPVSLSDGRGGVGTVVWGPLGKPRLERDYPVDPRAFDMNSVLDWMVYPWGSMESDPLAIVDDPDRLLLGPNQLHIAAELANVTTSLYVMAGLTEGTPPLLCLHTALPGGDERRNCEDLATVREFGWQIAIAVDDREWMLTIGADSANHSIRLTPAN